MSFPNNNSRNVANLLRFQQTDLHSDQPQPRRQLPSLVVPQGQAQLHHGNQNYQSNYDEDKRMQRRKTPVQPRDGQDDIQAETVKVRLQQMGRYYEQRQSSIENKLIARLKELENFVMKEVPQKDTALLLNDVTSIKDTLKELKRQVAVQSHELVNLKNDKTNEQSNISREKEKSTVLFLQVVRLGESLEKMAEQFNGVTRNYESKLMDLQGKLSNSEKNLMIMSQRAASGTEVLTDLGEKVMSRLQNTQSNLIILGRQQAREKEALAKLMAEHDHIGEDLQQMVRNVQNDMQGKLEGRLSETFGRLMQEHEQRVRGQEEIKKNLEQRERITQEKQINDKLESKARYESIDALLRNELTKKEESIRHLHEATAQQFQTVRAQLQAEAGRRKEQENLFRTQIRRIQENLRGEYDLFKTYQSELADKFTEMIKAEIQVRLSSELDLKSLTSQIANQIVNDLNSLKEALANSNKKLSQSLREVSSESAERAGQLSHYVDQEVNRVAEVVAEKYNKMKGTFSKLAEQLRNHLLKTEANRQRVEGRLAKLQSNFDKLKTEVNVEIEEFYNDLETRLKEQKDFVETVVFKKNNDLNQRVNKLEQYTNEYFELLKAGISDNKQLLSKKLTGVTNSRPQENEEEMKELRTIVFNIKNLTEEIKEENQVDKTELKRELSLFQAREKEDILELDAKVTDKISKQAGKARDLEEKMNQFEVKLNRFRVDAGQPAKSISEDKLKKLSEDVEGLSIKVTTVIVPDINTLKQQIAQLQKPIGPGSHQNPSV